MSDCMSRGGFSSLVEQEFEEVGLVCRGQGCCMLHGHMSALSGSVTYFTVCPQRSILGTPVSPLFIKALGGLVNVECERCIMLGLYALVRRWQGATECNML